MPVLAVEGEDVGGEEDDEPLTEKSSLNQKVIRETSFHGHEDMTKVFCRLKS